MTPQSDPFDDFVHSLRVKDPVPLVIDTLSLLISTVHWCDCINQGLY